MYDKIEDEESQMIEARAKRQAIEAEKLTGDNIYKVLMCFDKLYSAMNDVERRRVMEALISEIQIHEDRQPNGQWLKSIRFRLPIIEEDMNLSLDNNEHVEAVLLLTKLHVERHIEVDVNMEELDVTAAESKATYNEIRDYMWEHYQLKVSNLYIAQVKQKYGIIERENYHKAKNENAKQPQCPKEKEDAIVEALKHFKMI